MRKKLKGLDEKFWLIFKQSPVAYCLIDREGALIDVNESTARLFGYSREELRGKRILDLNIAAPEERPKLRGGVARWKAGLPVARPDFALIRKDGGRVFVEARGFPIKVASGRIGLVTIVDISDRVRAHELVLQRQKELRQFFRRILLTREEQKRRFQEDIHREIGHITGTINLCAVTVEKDIRRGDIEAALDSCRKFKSTFGDFISRLRNLALDLRPPELDLLGLRSALANYLSRIEKETGLRIDFRASLDETRLGDDTPIVFFRIAQEAVNNVLKHSRAKRAGVALRFRNGRITLAVRDNGQGFDVSRTGHEGEPSMGLRLIREMAESQDGTFEIHSQPGNGTELLVSLPAPVPSPSKPPASPAPAPARPASPKRRRR